MRRAVVGVLLLALAGCAGEPLAAVERLDARTAVHTVLMPEPWVYAREMPMLAAHVRDYLNVGVLQTNRAGTRAWWLGVVAWSTLDRHAAGQVGAGRRPDRIRLEWEGAALVLAASPAARESVGLSEPAFTEDALDYVEAWCPLSAAQLARLAAAPPLRVTLLEDGHDDAADGPTYAAWRVRAQSLDALLESVGAPAAPHRP